ncbi:MAG: TniQ family protein, partial [Variovorax sp.]
MRRAVRPYPDELLSSALIRFCRQYRLSSHGLANHVLGLPGWRLSFMCGLPLQPICDLLGTSADQLLRQHTPLPYAGAFTSDEIHRRSWSDAIAGAESAPLRALMCNAISDPSMRRFCSSCVREDLLMHGESYWHLSHQLPGVLACVRHGRALRWSTIPFNVKGPGQLTLPSECRGRQIRLHPPTLIAIAIDSVDLLKCREPDQRSAQFYRHMAQSRGYL